MDSDSIKVGAHPYKPKGVVTEAFSATFDLLYVDPDMGRDLVTYVVSRQAEFIRAMPDWLVADAKEAARDFLNSLDRIHGNP